MLQYLRLTVDGYIETLNPFLEKVWNKFTSSSITPESFKVCLFNDQTLSSIFLYRHGKIKKFLSQIIKEKMATDLNNMTLEEKSEHMIFQMLCKQTQGVGNKLNMFEGNFFY